MKIQDTADRVAEAVYSSGTDKTDMRSSLMSLPATVVSGGAVTSAGFYGRLSSCKDHALFPKIALVRVLSDLIPY